MGIQPRQCECVCEYACTCACVRAHVCRAAAGAGAPGAGAGARAGAAGAKAGAGAGAGPSLLIAIQPPNYFRQTPETPEPLNKYIFYDADVTPEGKRRYLPGVS